MQKLTARSIQSQLIIYFSIAIIIPTIISSVVGLKLLNDQIITRSESKCISDLNSAREIYRNKIKQIESIARFNSVRVLIIEAVKKRDIEFLKKDIPRVLKREQIDIINITDQKGQVLVRGSNPTKFGDSIFEDRFVRETLKNKKIVSGTEIVSREMLLKDSYALAEQALMKITPTPKAKPRKDSVETSGMMIKSAVPIFDESNNCIGVITAGILLNRNFEIVDKIKEIVHEGEVYKGQEIGTATIFQGDLRISTNVKNLDGSRAITSLVSEEVYDQVLINGKRWVGEAFVVNSWYITAYEPIRDIENNIIGILYVGILKQPFTDILRNTILTFIGIVITGLVLIIFISILMAKKIATPLRTLEMIASQIATGDYQKEIKIRAPREIESLANSINQMAKDLDSEKRELEEWGKTLEKKVQQRTDEIKKIHSQLFRSEKLAAIGKLAAGVAHEINNPLTGILTNASLLKDELSDDDPRKEDLEVIVKETIRCREIVKRLLDFARQTKPHKTLTNINQLIENIILLVRNQTSFRNIHIEKNLAD
ncbi:MAG: cache domain-containing protein, partial [Ignavibacteria bacterium]|nr:cache domain-containing protein [Ignavibacteria bacterium]